MKAQTCALLIYVLGSAHAVALDLSEPLPFSDASHVKKEFEDRYLVGFSKVFQPHQDLEIELTTNAQGGVREARLFRVPRPPFKPLDEKTQEAARQWLVALGSESFDEREAASAALIRLGRGLESMLVTDARTDPEVEHRYHLIYRSIEGMLELDEARGYLQAMQFDRAAAGKRFLLTFSKSDLDATVPALKEFPLWNGIESAEAYAQRAGVPPTRRLLLKDGTPLELILVPRARFTFGAIKPEPPAAPPEDRLIWAYLGGAALAVLALALFLRAAIKRRSWSFSLGYLFLFVLAAALGLWGVVDWQRGIDEQARYEEALRGYNQRSTVEQQNAREIEFQRPYYLSKYEVTWRQYRAVMDASDLQEVVWINGGRRSEILDHLAKARPDSPAFGMAWDDARYFMEKLSRDLPGTFRLPTEAEWEFACNGGRTDAYSFGPTERDLEAHAWYFHNILDTSKIPGFDQDQWNQCMRKDYYSRLSLLWTTYKAMPMNVGLKAPNAMGFFDMHGNVWELCYDNMVKVDGIHFIDAQPSKEFPSLQFVPYVLCGGGFSSNPQECRTGYRLRTHDKQVTGANVSLSTVPVGFRVVMELEEPKPFDPVHLQR